MESEERRILADAQRVLQKTFLFDNPWDMEATNFPITFEGEIDWEHQPFDDPEWTFMLARCAFITNLAKAFVLTKEKKYLSEIKTLITAFIVQVPHTKDRKETCWRSLDAAIRVQHWTNAYPLLVEHGLVDDSFSVLFRSSMESHVAFLAPLDSPFLKLSNWGTIGNAGLYFGSVFLGDEKNQELALEKLSENVVHSILADGWQWEQSPMYHGEVLFSLLHVIQLADKYKKTVPSIIREKAQAMCHATLASMKTDGRQFLQSDSDDTSVRDMLTLGALVFRDSALKFGGYPALDAFASEEEHETYNALGTLVPSYNSIACEASGNYYLRSGWGADDTVVHFRCGPLGSGHGHADLLHVDVSKGGEDILVDSGRFSYVDGPRRRALKAGSSHNTIQVDGEDCFTLTDSWGYAKRAMPLQKPMVITGDWSLCEGSHLGYHPLVVQRSVLLLGKDLIIIIDSLITDSRHTYDRYFHFANTAEVVGTAHSVSFVSRTLDAKLYPDGKESIMIEQTPYSPHYNQLETKPTARLSSHAEGSTSLVSVLHLGEREFPSIMTEVPVVLSGSKKVLDAKKARAFSVTRQNAEDLTILVCLEPCLEGVDLLCAKDLCGYGRIIVKQGSRQEVLAY
ncbi:MAG: alginate lyase family protein [Sphaerochaeta sp.]|nr:alginate lyase family protein [Sphaerochaeta sp.]